jgi:hypothetical protein
MSDEAAAPGELRCSDAERETAAVQLRRAAGEGRLTVEELDERLDAAYAARTRGELERLLTDLPPSLPAAPGAPPPAPRGDEPIAPARRSVIAILGGADLRGRCHVGPRTSVVAVMGGTDVDLNDAVFDAREVVLNVFCLMGGVEIRVPEGVHVVDEVTAILGGADSDGPAVEPPVGAPVVRVRGVAIMGGVDVRRGRKKRLRDRLRRGGEAER